jgi:hypothetical protein
MTPYLFNATLGDGRTVQIFVNPDDNLLVVDVVEKSGKFGNEIVRQTIPPPFKASEKRSMRRQVQAQDAAVQA